MICSVFGHRKIEECIDDEKLKYIFLYLITEKGVDTFYFGEFGEFDRLCHKIVTELKKAFTHLSRVYCLEDAKLLLPKNAVKYLDKSKYEDFVFLPLSFDGWYKRIYFRNCAMIDASDFIVFYAKERPDSGAWKAYKYAVKRKKLLVNIG